jgi:hypothetical protein
VKLEPPEPPDPPAVEHTIERVTAPLVIEKAALTPASVVLEMIEGPIEVSVVIGAPALIAEIGVYVGKAFVPSIVTEPTHVPDVVTAQVFWPLRERDAGLKGAPAARLAGAATTART